jgi:hypothetical protein
MATSCPGPASGRSEPHRVREQQLLHDQDSEGADRVGPPSRRRSLVEVRAAVSTATAHPRGASTSAPACPAPFFGPKPGGRRRDHAWRPTAPATAPSPEPSTSPTCAATRPRTDAGELGGRARVRRHGSTSGRRRAAAAPRPSWWPHCPRSARWTRIRRGETPQPLAAAAAGARPAHRSRRPRRPSATARRHATIAPSADARAQLAEKAASRRWRLRSAAVRRRPQRGADRARVRRVARPMASRARGRAARVGLRRLRLPPRACARARTAV